MIDSIFKLLEVHPFVPFTIVTSAGLRYRVASPEHISISPKRGRVTIYLDDDSAVWISALHIVTVEGAAYETAQ